MASAICDFPEDLEPYIRINWFMSPTLINDLYKS